MVAVKLPVRRISVYGGLVFFCFFAAAPILWMVITVFKGDWDLYRSRSSPFLFNKYPTLENQPKAVIVFHPG